MTDEQTPAEPNPQPAPEAPVEPVTPDPAAPVPQIEERAQASVSKLNELQGEGEDNEKAAARYWALMGFLDQLQAQTSTGVSLVCRGDDLDPWTQVGFVIEKVKGRDYSVVHAKVGSHPYQPIGKLGGQAFWPTTGSKLFWAMDFAWMKPDLIARDQLPFRVAKREVVESQADDAATLTDGEVEAFTEAFKAISQELETFKEMSQNLPIEKDAQGNPVDPPVLTEQQWRVGQTITYYCCQPRCRKLDQHLKAFAQANPALNSAPGVYDLANAVVSQLAQVVTEWLRMKLNDDSARRYHQSHELLPNAATTERNLIEGTLRELDRLNPAVEPELVRNRLEAGMAILPGLAEALTAFRDTSDLAGAHAAALAWLRGKLPPA